jgi:Zn-dependent protease with chaperone function
MSGEIPSREPVSVSPSGGVIVLTAPERVSFFAEQARRRRGTWRLSIICLLIASGIGIVLSTIVTPLLLLTAGALLKTLVVLGVAPEEMRLAAQALGRWAAYHIDNFGLFVAALDKVNGLRDLGVTLRPLLLLSSLCIPALVAAGLVWFWARATLMRIAGEDLVHSLQARPANRADPEEHQLSNIVEEVAIAAGMPPPRLLLIDQPAVNAAAVGRSHQNATVLVTRGLIDRLDRSETTAIVAHLIASIGEGDTRITCSILAVFQTFAFFLTILDLPIRVSAWRALGGLALVALWLRRSPEAVARTEALLEKSIDADSMPDVERMIAWFPFPRFRMLVLAPLLPFMLISMLLKLVLFLWTALFLGPPLSLLWRTRRYAADATTVQLTRDPDALARALQHIAGSVIPVGGEGREYFFIHASGSDAKGGFANRRTMSVSLHPSIARRVRRLVAVGAAPVRATRFSAIRFEEIARHPVQAAIVVCLLLLLLPLGLALVLLVGYITAIVMTVGLAAGMTLVAAFIGP